MIRIGWKGKETSFMPEKEDDEELIRRMGFLYEIESLLSDMQNIESIHKVYVYANEVWMHEHPETFKEELEKIRKRNMGICAEDEKIC